MENRDFNKYKSEWLKWLYHEKRLSKNTCSSYELDIKNFSKFIISYQNEALNINLFEKIDEKTIRAWFFFRLKNGTNSRSNARALSSVKSLTQYLINKKIIQSSIILYLKSPKFTESLPRPLSIKQIEKIIEILKENKKNWVARRNISIILLMWGLGLRINEVLNLTLSQFVNSDDYILVTGKGKKQRIVPIFKELKQFIIGMNKSIPIKIKNDDFLFIGEQGKRLNPSIFQKEIRKIRSILLLPENVTPHTFRHSFATQLLDSMVDLRSIQELLGHESLTSTQKYTAVDSDRLKKIINIYHPRNK